MATIAAMKRGQKHTAAACWLAAALMCAWPAAAAPLRVSLDALDAAGAASTAGTAAEFHEAARFVPAGPGPQRARAADDGEDVELAPTLELPRPARVLEPGLPAPDGALGMLHLLGGADGSTAATKLMAAERRLGDFGPTPAPSDGGPVSDEAQAQAQVQAQALDEAEGVGVEAEAASPRPTAVLAATQATAAAPARTLGEPDYRRMLTLMVVVPLVLAATALLWHLDRSGRHRRSRSRRAHHQRSEGYARRR